MTTSARPPAHPLHAAARWLSAHARFPASRLAPRAETMLCVSILAAQEQAEQGVRHALERRVGSQTSALRAHVLRRTQVHFKCDNSAKV
ncbi:MAG: hypothetical protein JNK23_09095 [Opitutaceae bacterium]|nr:hypothetical protein [Opitutaceae bacterium]